MLREQYLLAGRFHIVGMERRALAGAFLASDESDVCLSHASSFRVNSVPGQSFNRGEILAAYTLLGSIRAAASLS